MKNRISTVALIGLSASSALAAPVMLTAPTGLADGTKFRFLFVTTGTITAESSNIDDYNAFVNSQAGGATYNGSVVSWKALGSTTTVDARNNVGGFGSSVAIYLVNGTKIANDMTTSAGGLWGGSVLSGANLNISATTSTGMIWTGSFASGQAKIDQQGNFALGSGNTSTFGFNPFTSSTWIDFASTACTATNRMYGVSQELTVGAVPAPGAFAMLGLAGAASKRRRRA